MRTVLIGEKIHDSDLLAHYGELLSPRSRQILTQLLDEDFTLQEIAELEGISRQAVHQVVRQAKLKLRQFEAVLHVAERQRRCLEALDAIRDSALSPDHEHTDEAFLQALELMRTAIEWPCDVADSE